jgi:adenine/guanine phosphoribosyltransferase-like PRPP-binding protein
VPDVGLTFFLPDSLSPVTGLDDVVAVTFDVEVTVADCCKSSTVKPSSSMNCSSNALYAASAAAIATAVASSELLLVVAAVVAVVIAVPTAAADAFVVPFIPARSDWYSIVVLFSTLNA